MKDKFISTNNLVLALFFILSSYWFFNILTIGLDMDEVTYTLNSQFYFHRKQANLKAFTLPEKVQNLNWDDQQNQLLDQPQLGKFIFGFILDLTKKNPWTNQDLSWLYQEFALLNLPQGNSLNQVRYLIGNEMVNAIIVLRYSSAIAGLISLLLIAYSVNKISNNAWIGALAFSLSSLHPLMRQYLRIATTNSLSLLFLVLSSFLIFSILKKFKHLPPLTLLLSSLFLGTLAAASTSIKLNGVLLLAFPFLYILTPLLLSKEKTKTRQEAALIKKIFVFTIGISIGFISTFYYLEPELWQDPLKGIQLLIETRLIQQQKFFQYFGEMSIFETLSNMIKNYLNISNYLILKVFLFYLIPIGIWNLWNQSKKNKNKKILLYFSLFVPIATLLYVRVKGFDRYFIPTTLIAIMITSISTEKFITAKKR